MAYLYLGKTLGPRKTIVFFKKANRTNLKDTSWQQDKGPTLHHVPISKKAIQDEEP